MPLNQGTLISSPIRPLSPGMTIATALSNEILGGLHSVQTLSDRDLITTDRRQFGMLVYIINDDDFYQLKQISSPDISDNLNWDLINISGVASTTEWLDSVISISGTPPGSPTLGDRYLVSSGSGLWSGLDDYIVEWDGSNWNPTIPTEGTTIRVDDDSDAIFSFIQGVWTRYEFVKEPWTLRYDVPLGLTLSVSTGSQYLIYGDLNVDGGIDSWGNITILNGQLTGSGSVATFSFGTLQQIELLTEIIGATGITVSTGSLGERIISTNLIAGTGISFSYGPGTEIEINSVFPTFPGGRPKYIIEAVETITVPDNELYYIYGDLEVRGTLDIGTAGKVVVTNGALIAASGSTINNVGNVEIYTLLTSANDGIKIDISQITFGKEGRILFESELKYIPILGATARVVTESDDLVYSTSSSYPSSTSSTAFDRYLGISVADPLKKLHINGSGILIDGNESEQDLSLGDPNWARFVIDSGNSDTHTLMDLRNDEGRVLYASGDIDGGFRFPSVSIGKTPSNTLFNVSDYYGNDYFSIGMTGIPKVGILENDNSIDKVVVWDDSTNILRYRDNVALNETTLRKNWAQTTSYTLISGETSSTVYFFGNNSFATPTGDIVVTLDPNLSVNGINRDFEFILSDALRIHTSGTWSVSYGARLLEYGPGRIPPQKLSFRWSDNFNNYLLTREILNRLEDDFITTSTSLGHDFADTKRYMIHGNDFSVLSINSPGIGSSKVFPRGSVIFAEDAFIMTENAISTTGTSFISVGLSTVQSSSSGGSLSGTSPISITPSLSEFGLSDSREVIIPYTNVTEINSSKIIKSRSRVGTIRLSEPSMLTIGLSGNALNGGIVTVYVPYIVDNVTNFGTFSQIHERSTLTRNNIIKSGVVNGASFSGGTFSVIFTRPYPNNSYSINISGEDALSWSVDSKANAQFVINSNTMSSFTGEVYWQTITYGEL